VVQSVVDRLHSEFRQLIEELGNTQISLRTTLEEVFQKSLLLAAASYFERRVKEDIIDFMYRTSGNVDLVSEFIRNKAVERQYHTFFQWEARNANAFFGLFGEEFKNYMAQTVSNDQAYQEAILAFLELGRERNRLVHQDFGAFPLEKTTDEIFDLYRKALTFVDHLQSHFEAYVESRRSSSDQ